MEKIDCCALSSHGAIVRGIGMRLGFEMRNVVHRSEDSASAVN